MIKEKLTKIKEHVQNEPFKAVMAALASTGGGILIGLLLQDIEPATSLPETTKLFVANNLELIRMIYIAEFTAAPTILSAHLITPET